MASTDTQLEMLELRPNPEARYQPSDGRLPLRFGTKNKKTATGCFRPPFLDFDFVAA
jgi:hypothetical protein